MNKEIYNGWTVQSFISILKPQLNLVMESDPIKSKKELDIWCSEHQPFYKNYIHELSMYFCEMFNIPTNISKIINDYEFTAYPSEDVIEIEVVSNNNKSFLYGFNIVVENNDVIDFSGIFELSDEDIQFIKFLGYDLKYFIYE